MNNLLRLQFTGIIEDDAIARGVQGKTVIHFSVVNTRAYIDREGDKQKIEVIACEHSKGTVELANALRKGMRVYVEGIPEARNSSLFVRVSHLEYVPGKSFHSLINRNKDIRTGEG